MSARIAWVATLVLVASSAHAAKVYKCAEGGQTVYQSLPCPAQSDTGITRPVIGDPKLSHHERQANEQMLYQARRRMQAEAGRGAPAIRGSVIENLADPEACENARWRRELHDAFGKPAAEKDRQQLKDACRAP